MEEMIYGAGCVPTVMDGTEHEFTCEMMNIPEEYSYVSVMPPIRDQGETSECVCYSLTAWLDWYKNLKENDNNGCQFNVDELYSVRARKDLDGMQIKEALHYLLHTGLSGYKIHSYSLIPSVEMMKRAIIMNGPIAIGMMVKSFDSMYWRGTKNYGGHCTLIVGYNKEGFIIRNSWGTSWANNGYTLLPYSDAGLIFEAWTCE